MGEYDATGARVQEISYLAQPGEGPGTAIPVAINRAGAHYFINPDHLNSSRSIGYANGQNVWTRNPSPFGEDVPNQNPSGFGVFTYNPGPFPGQYRDSETGLAYNMLRDYAPKAGRYVQSDPIGLAGGSFSTYGYVGGNPLGRVDPWGLDWFLFVPGTPGTQISPDALTSADQWTHAYAPRPSLGQLAEPLCQSGKQWWDSPEGRNFRVCKVATTPYCIAVTTYTPGWYKLLSGGVCQASTIMGCLEVSRQMSLPASHINIPPSGRQSEPNN